MISFTLPSNKDSSAADIYNEGHHSRHFTHQCYESGLRNFVPLVFKDLQNPYWNLIETQFISQFVSQYCFSIWEIFSCCMDYPTPVWYYNRNMYLTCKARHSVLILSFKASFWHLVNVWVLKKSIWSFSLVKC